MAGKHEGLKNEINRGSTEKRQDAILMTSSHRQKCLWLGLINGHHPIIVSGNPHSAFHFQMLVLVMMCAKFMFHFFFLMLFFLLQIYIPMHMLHMHPRSRLLSID